MQEELNGTATVEDVAVEQVETGDTAQTEQTEGATSTDVVEATNQHGKTFTQTELDTIIEKRIAKERQRIDNNPHLSYLSEKAKSMGMTLDELIESDRKYEEQRRINELVEQSVPEEYAKEMLENRKFREQYQTKLQQEEQNAKTLAMYNEFLSAYPNLDEKSIPSEVWGTVAKGKSLLDAYISYENKTLKEQLENYKKLEQTQQANISTASTSTGSAKSNGSSSEFITQETFEANRGNQSWVNKNYQRILESRQKW